MGGRKGDKPDPVEDGAVLALAQAKPARSEALLYRLLNKSAQ